MSEDFAPVFLVADFEEHFDSDVAERRKPHCAAVINFDDVCACVCGALEKFCKIPGAVNDEKFEHYVATLTHENLFQNPRKQICVNISAAQNRANGFVWVDFDFFRKQCRDACRARAFNHEAIILDAMKNAARNFFF